MLVQLIAYLVSVSLNIIIFDNQYTLALLFCIILSITIVICFSDGAESFSSNGNGDGTVWLDDVDCPPGSSSITDCTHAGWGTENCSPQEDVMLVCNTGNEINWL